MLRTLISSFLLALIAVPPQAMAQDTDEGSDAIQLAARQLSETFAAEWTFDTTDGRHECQMIGELTTLCVSEWATGLGEMQAVWVTRWDRQAEVFRSHRFYGNGYADSGLTWVDGDTWTSVYEGLNGARYRATQVYSEDGVSWTWHRSLQAGPWEKRSEGSATKIK